jgi:hypothetical protein
MFSVECATASVAKSKQYTHVMYLQCTKGYGQTLRSDRYLQSQHASFVDFSFTVS